MRLRLHRCAVEWPLPRAAVRARTAEDEDTPSSSPAMAALQQAKAAVPPLRAALGDRQWYATVDALHPAPLHGTERDGAINRAFYKMHEVMATCCLPPPLRSLHLCEAPGGFVQCVRLHHCESGEEGGERRWTWTAVSLPPACGGVAFSERLLAEAAPWETGAVVHADLLADEWRCGETFDLATADGAAGMDHAALEASHFPLLLAQTRAAVRHLAAGGTFVIKFFEGGRRETRLWIAALTQRFDAVSVLKPLTSRATNSERYLVCRGHRGPGEFDAAVVANAGWERDAEAVLDRLAADQTRALDCAVRGDGPPRHPRPPRASPDAARGVPGGDAPAVRRRRHRHASEVRGQRADRGGGLVDRVQVRGGVPL